MAKIELADTNFKVIPEGEYAFKVTKVEYKEEFSKVNITCETKEGDKHIERFDLSKEGGARAFSYFAKCALNDMSASNIDTDDLLGCYFKGTVEHDVVVGDDGKERTFAHIKDRKAVDEDFEGWVTEKKDTTKKVEPKEEPKEEVSDSDLDDILNS